MPPCTPTPPVVDLSHAIADGMPAFPGLPAPRIGLHLAHEASRPHYDGRAEFAIGTLEMVGNTGTYLDSPFHRFPDAPDVSDLPLDRLVDRPAVVVDVRAGRADGRAVEVALDDVDLAGRIVLFRSDWDARWGTGAYWDPGPFLGAATVAALVAKEPAVVGVDWWNVDDPADPARPVHTRLLAAGIPIVEHLTGLGSVPEPARVSVVPLAVRGAPSVPVRAYAVPA